MKVKVIISFHDASNFARVYQQGDIIDVTEDRAQKLLSLKLVEPCEAEAPKKVETPKPVEPPVEAPVETPKEEAPKKEKTKTPKKKKS